MAHREKEQQPHEIFVGNTLRDGDHFKFLVGKGLNTIRQGAVALDIEGKPLPFDYAPAFINRSEADRHNEIMMQRTFGPNWRRG